MKYDLAIATTYFAGPYGNCDGEDRAEYFDQMLESARHVDWPSDKRFLWIVSDDASIIPARVTNLPIDFMLVRHTKNKGNLDNITWVVGEAAKWAEWVMYADNDGMFSRDCFHRMFALLARYPWCNAFTAFNTKYHGKVALPISDDRLMQMGVTEVDFPDHCLKQSTCEHGFTFRADNWANDGTWSCNLMSGLRCENPPYPCLKPSGLQHIGKRGLNGTMDDYDVDFVLEGVS